MMLRRRFARLAWVLVMWTWCVAMLGAYVRLSDAGLGCPDWPGCYGYIYAPHQSQHLTQAAELFPNSPVHVAKAWKEMIHRYAVSILSLGILVLFVGLSISQKRLKERWLSPNWGIGIIIWLVGQALFGMWTVTMKLTPWVVTVHLLGGMLLLAGLVSVATRLSGHRVIEAPISKRRFYVSAVIILAVVQIGLGGWVSTHYAAGACGNTFPLCRGHWMPSVMKWQPLLELSHPAGYTLAGDIFPATALVAIHWLHRCGALCVTLAVALLGSYFFRFGAKVWAYKVWVCLVIQLSLGMGNIYWNLPLPLAVAHNGGAALLLSTLVFIFQRISMDVEMKHSVQSV